MNFVAFKMLVGDRLKYLSLIAGLLFASLLTTQQTSIFNGFAKRTGSWIRDTAVADLWVMDAQVDHTEDFKLLLENQLDRVRGVKGVAWASPIYKNFVNVILPDGTRQNFRVVGIDDATLIGGPPEMVQGSLADLRRDKAVVINANIPVMMGRLEKPRALQVGDRLSLNDNEAIVVGSYKATTEFFWDPVLYTTYSRAKELRKDNRRTLMYMLVKVQPGQDIAAVAERITASTGLRAVTSEQFEAQSQEWILARTGIKVNFGITIALGFVIGILTAGQTLYTFILDNLRYFAALKAMGTSNRTLLKMVLLQVTLVTLLGFGIGIGIAALTGRMMSGVGLAFEMTWQIALYSFLGLLTCTTVAASLSLVRVLKLEPAIVFK